MDSSDEESGSEDEPEDSSDEEEMWEVRAIHGQRGKAKSLQYDVEGETGERTWEPPSCFPPNNEVLAKWKADQKK